MKAFYRKASLLCVFLAIFALFLGIVVAEDSTIFYVPVLNESVSDESITVMEYDTPEITACALSSEDESICSLSVEGNSEDPISITGNLTKFSGDSSSSKNVSISVAPNEIKNINMSSAGIPPGNIKIKVTDEIANVKNFYYANVSSDGIVRNLPTKITEEEFNTDNEENGIVTDNRIEITIKVDEAPEPILPIANFHSNVISGYAPLSVQFTDLSENANEVSWDFGDGATSTEQNVTHTYSTAGIYTVNLTASNANGTDSKTATINVLKSIPTITWNNPADIVYGTSLSNTQLNAVASVPGTFDYTPTAGTVLPAGTQTLNVAFTPTDNANYTTVTANVSINVKPGSFSSITASGFHAPTTFGPNGYDYIWFNSNFKASGVKDGTKIYLTNSTIITAMGNFSVPGAIITFSSAATSTTTIFDQSKNAWITTVPLSGTDDIFLSGMLLPIKTGDLSQDSQVTWNGYFATNIPAISINWKWGAAVYTSDLSNYSSALSNNTSNPSNLYPPGMGEHHWWNPYNAIGVKASHNLASGYNNGDQAGTPENLKDYLVAGARGGGGSNWCGSWSGTASIKP